MAALLLERHSWETGGPSHQIQIPKAAFASFFHGTGNVPVSVWSPRTAATPHRRTVLLSHYQTSDTYRFNKLLVFGTLGHAVVVFEESGDPSRPYHVWWFTRAAAQRVLARPLGWNQAKPSQYGPGRKWAIVQGPTGRLLI